MGDMTDENGVVRIGAVVFALIRPTPGRELAFNDWYERDHYYTTGLAAPGVFSGGRFIQPELGWHLALYFVLPGHEDARVAYASEQVALAVDEERMFADREHLHTWTYTVESSWQNDRGVAAALSLDRRFGGLRVSFVDDSTVPDQAGACGLVLQPATRVMPSTWDGEFDSARRRTVVEFHDNRPPDNGAPAAWTDTFVPMIFGTDTHVTPDES